MDHVVRINGLDNSVKPIVLHLLPGEETIFNLVVVNDGDPSDLSISASDPVFKAVRFRRSDNHVDTKENIPIFARMPLDKDRLEGELILTSSCGETRVPITIFRDSDGYGLATHGTPGLKAKEQGRPDRPKKASSRAVIRDITSTGRVETEVDEEETALYRRGNSDIDIDSDSDDEEVDGEEGEEGEKRADSLYEGSEDGNEPDIPIRDINNEDEKETAHIVFSKDIDLERYRSSRRPRRVEDLSRESSVSRSQERDGKSDRGYAKKAIEYDRVSSLDSIRVNHRIDDRFTSRAAARDVDHFFGPGEKGDPDRSGEESDPYEPESRNQDFQSEDGTQGGLQGSEAFFGLNRRDDLLEESDSHLLEADHETEYPEEDDSSALGAMQVIPAAIFLALVAVLVLTFITETIPEFPGALVSSILIVTLIIYGAATLLKA